MSKKERRITDFQFKAGIVILLIVGLFYFGFMQERFIVSADNLDEALLVKDHLSYKTEFCANRLTELSHEIYFLQKTISKEELVLGEEKILQEQEQEVLVIEQRELQDVNAEFNSYKLMCDQFDESPTEEFCIAFLEEAKTSLELSQKNADSTTGLEHLGIVVKDLRNAHRIYEGLQEVCNEK